jgi:hypothetical protein
MNQRYDRMATAELMREEHNLEKMYYQVKSISHQFRCENGSLQDAAYL